MNRILNDIPVYASKVISDQVKNDKDILNLSIGEPFYDPPDSLQNRTRPNSTNSNKYSDPRGEIDLRKEIAERYIRLYGVPIDPESNVLVTHGAADAILTSILTLTSIGDEIIIPDPSYMLYQNHANLLGRKPVRIASVATNGFLLQPDDIKSAITDRTSAIIINSPENPTGSVYDQEMIDFFKGIAHLYNLYFIHDEVYDSFVFNGTHKNVFRTDPQVNSRCVLINSFSKRFSMMGYRLGWLVGPKDIIDNAVKVHTLTTLTLRSPEQHIAATILNDPGTFNYLEHNLGIIKENVSILVHALRESWAFDITGCIPQGAFFIFPSVTRLFGALPEQYRHDNKTIGECVAQYLLLEHKLAVVPGYIYGQQGNDRIRIVAAVEQHVALAAADRIRRIMRPKTAKLLST